MKAVDYQQRINKVLDYIDAHIDESLTTAKLCDVAHFSKYHFHRLFSALVGMPLIKYVQYIKLKRAAYQLCYQHQKQILTIALDAGFESHEAFSRAFKKICDMSPSQFRKAPNWPAWQLQPYKRLRGITMEVTIKTIEPIHVVLAKHRGDVNLLHETINKLINWCKANNLPPKDGEAYGIGYDDPHTTPVEEFRFDVCRKISETTEVKSNEVEAVVIPGGRYAIARHLGSRENLGDTIYKLYRDWLPQSGEALRDQPCFFQYHNFEHEVQESALITDVYLPLK